MNFMYSGSVSMAPMSHLNWKSNKHAKSDLGGSPNNETRGHLAIPKGKLCFKSIKYLRGIVDDVLVKVDKFIFTADFIVLDMVENIELPFILGRSFLATGKALIDVQEGN